MSFPKRLDRSRDVGQISPPMPHPSVDGCVAHYEQDGYFFDHEGLFLEPFLTEAQKAKAAQPAAKDAAGKTGQKPKKEPKTRTEKREAEPKKKQAGSDELNLEAWLRGEEVYPEFRIKKVVRDRYNRVFNNIGDVVEFLVTDQNLVPRDALKDEFRKTLSPAQG